MVEGGGFEPPKAEPTDLQSAPFDRSGTPPRIQNPKFSLVCDVASTIFIKNWDDVGQFAYQAGAPQQKLCPPGVLTPLLFVINDSESQ